MNRSDNELWMVGYAIYDSKEDAQAFADWVNGDPANSRMGIKPVKPIRVFKNCYISKIKNGYERFRVSMKRDGTVIGCIKFNRGPPTKYGMNQFVIMYGGLDEKQLNGIIFAKDEEEAIKITNNYRIKSLLDDIWLTKRVF